MSFYRFIQTYIELPTYYVMYLYRVQTTIQTLSYNY